jgi:hypothetical protein
VLPVESVQLLVVANSALQSESDTEDPAKRLRTIAHSVRLQGLPLSATGS